MPDLSLNEKWKFSKIYRAVWKSKASAKAKLVFAALEWFGEKKFPSYPTLAEMCSLSPAGVKRAIAELEAEGFLSKETRNGTSNRYELFPEGTQAKLDLVQDDPGHGDQGHKDPTLRPNRGQGDPLTRHSSNETPGLPPGEGPKPKKQFEDLWCKLYEETFGKKFHFTPRDAKAAKELVATHTVPELEAMVRAAWQSPQVFVASRSRSSIYGFAEVINQVNAGGKVAAPALSKYDRSDVGAKP